MSAYYLTPQAAAGTESIWDYIAEDSGVSRADKVVDDIFAGIERLSSMPRGSGNSCLITYWNRHSPGDGNGG